MYPFLVKEGKYESSGKNCGPVKIAQGLSSIAHVASLFLSMVFKLFGLDPLHLQY